MAKNELSKIESAHNASGAAVQQAARDAAAASLQNQVHLILQKNGLSDILKQPWSPISKAKGSHDLEDLDFSVPCGLESAEVDPLFKRSS
ncbi:MAG TPA: hypothetical protein V6D17_18145 [Candidatus Obscuribacterales bacterium]